MKHLVLSTFLLFAGLLTFGSVAVAQEVVNGAKIEFEKEVHDYGQVKYGGNGTSTFEFTNTGNAPLIISRAQGSCGCTVPEWPKEPIVPGGKGKITVKYDTKRSGPISKSVTISSNAVNDPAKTIKIKGNVGPAPDSTSPINNSGAPTAN